MAKTPPKCLKSQSNPRTSIHRHIKVKRLKNLQQQSSQKTEARKSNNIMEQLDESDGNRQLRENNINQFAPLYESDYEEDTKHR